MGRVIVHLDADAFFASVEQAADPRLRGKAIAVGGERRGIIASASYEARRFGVYTPMPTARARKLCPKLIVLPGDFERYEQFSRWMFNYCYDFTPDVEQTSIDEGYFDLTANRQRRPVEIALTIRQAIGQSLKISVSEGLGANKLVSQIASKLNKPAAFKEVLPGEEQLFLHPLPNRWLPGIGPKTSARLNAAGLAEVRHIAATPPELLQLVLGNQAPLIRQFAHGIDERPLIPAKDPAKSFSQQETFGQDLTDEEYAEAVLRRMADHLFAKVREEGRSVRTLTVKVRYNDMAEDQCAESLLEPTDLETDVYGRLRVMLRQAWKRRVSLRMVSLKLANVYEGVFRSELPLDREAEQQQARERLARVVDDLRKTRGQAVVLRGHDFRLKEAPGILEARTTEGGGRKESSSRLTSVVTGFRKAASYVPLRVHSYYSFLDSTLSPEAIVALAKEHGCPAVALTDTGNLHGAVAFVQAAKAAGIKPILGVELSCAQHPLLLYVENSRGYHNLCRLLTCRAERSAGDEESVAVQQARPTTRGELEGLTDGLIAVSSDPSLADLFPGAFYQLATKQVVAAVERVTPCAPGLIKCEDGAHRVTRPTLRFMGSLQDSSIAHGGHEPTPDPSQEGSCRRASAVPLPSLEGLGVGRFMERDGVRGLPVVACPVIRYATAADRLKFDIVQSIRTRTLLKQAHPQKNLAGRFHFRAPGEMMSGCQDHPEWLEHTHEISERCQFEFPFGLPQFPTFKSPDGSSSCARLRQLVLEGFHRRYHGRRIVSDTGAAVSLEQVRAQVETELSIIAEVGYEDLFLITSDLLQECRRQGIEWITRGSAADSLVCYCLSISDVCPIRFGLYFRRFLNKERMALHKLPDIDVDFPHDRKDDVVNLLFAKYGPERCAVVGGFSTFQARSAVADVAKVLGVSEFQIRRFTEHFPWSFGGGWVTEDHHRAGGSDLLELLRASPECRDLPLDEEPFKTAVETGAFLDGFPRHPKMHPCGVVLSRQPMAELTPTFICNKGWPTTHLDMDAVEIVGLVKMDILAQGGLAVMRDAKAALAARGVEVDLNRCVAVKAEATGGSCSPASPDRLLASAATNEPWNDPAVWEMIASGNARAVHHIESPAMTSLCRMSNVREIDGLVAIVSVIRPGAANEQKKLKFTRRYQKMEPPEYPHPSLASCLRNTFGLVVYEEHILQICEAFAGLSPGRADVLRRALVKQKRKDIETIGQEFVAAARGRGHADEKIAEVWELVTSFNGYAFCKAHSTAYGVEAYQAAWLKRYYPAEFMAAVLTNGKGFYHPLVYVLECHRLGLSLLPPSVNAPGPGFMVEDGNRTSLSPLPLGGGEEGVIRVPLTRAKGLTERTTKRILTERARGPFTSLADFYRRAAPAVDEMEILIRVGAFDEFGQTRTRQFWEFQHLHQRFGQTASSQGWLLAPPGLEKLPEVPLVEPTRRQRLLWEAEYFDFAVSAHPLELYDNVAWDTYCPVARLGEHVGETVVTCGLIVEQRTHHQITGEPMKFLSLADRTGIVETELFAATYRSYGLATVRYPVLEVEARVEPFENARGFSLRVLRAGKPRVLQQPS